METDKKRDEEVLAEVRTRMDDIRLEVVKRASVLMRTGAYSRERMSKEEEAALLTRASIEDTISSRSKIPGSLVPDYNNLRKF